MEKSRKTKKSILIVLLLVVVGLSIGFAAFTSKLTIKSSATVKPNPNTFKVVFSTDSSESQGGSVTTDGTYAKGGSFATDATTIEGLTAEFTAPGQTATWEIYSLNNGEFDAFLNSVTVGNITCEAKEGTDNDKVTEAAKGIKLKVEVGSAQYETTTTGISSHPLAKGNSEKVKVTLSYEAGSAIADGDFTVKVGDIILGYDSVD